MNDTTPSPVTAAGTSADIDAQIAGLIGEEPATPQAARIRTDKLEQLHLAKSAAGGANASQTDAGPVEGFEPPASGLAYQFEQNVPPGVEIVDPVALGTLKGSLADAGVPAEIGNAAFGDIARLTADGAFASEAAYVDACGTCRSQLERVHGEGAKALIADAVSWIEAAVKANPALEDAATAALASPMAIQAAANMKRFGRARAR